MKTCRVEGCGRKREAKELCFGHYKRLRAGLPVDVPLQQKAPRTSREGACTWPGCPRKRWRQKLCSTHYARRQRAPEKMSLPVQPRDGYGARVKNLCLPDALLADAEEERKRRGWPRLAPVLREWMEMGWRAHIEEERQRALAASDFGRQRNSGPRRSA